MTYVQRTYSIVWPFECPFVLGGNSITSEPVPSRFALSTSPSGRNTTFASLGTSISPIMRKAFRAKASDLRHFAPKLLSLIIFFNTAVHAAFLSSGLFHFLMGYLSFGFHLFFGVKCRPSLSFEGLQLSALVFPGSFESARHPQSRQIVGREKAIDNRSTPR